MENKIEINIPNGYVLNEELSTVKQIVLTKKECKYVDLGLPSGRLWATENEEGYYTYDEAVEKFGKSLPGITAFAELVEFCKLEWDSEKRGMIVVGPNGNSIFFPALGYRTYDSGTLYNVGSYGYYWSASPNPSNTSNACHLLFYNGNVNPAYYNNRGYGCSVRLIKMINDEKF